MLNCKCNYKLLYFVTNIKEDEIQMRKNLFLILALLLITALVFSACGGNDAAPNGDTTPADDPDPVVEDDEEQGEHIDISTLSMFERDGFKDGQYFKYEYWQNKDGVETEGWLTMEVSESNGKYEVIYSGMIYDHHWANKVEDYEFSGVVTLPESDQPVHQFEEGRFQFIFGDYLARNTSSHDVTQMWRTISIPISEYYTAYELDTVGQVVEFDVFEIALDKETFANQEGYLITIKERDLPFYDVCIAPHIPLSLYSYVLESGNEYRIELVEYRE